MDFFTDHHCGLIMAEIEYNPKKYTRFYLMDLVSKTLGVNVTDVSNDNKYKNKNLALENLTKF